MAWVLRLRDKCNSFLCLSAPCRSLTDRKICRVGLNVSHLILGCRNAAKGEEGKKTVLAANRSAKLPTVEVWLVDMASYDSVLTFGKRARETLTRLDAVVLNAGVELCDFELAEALESTLTINVVSTFLLAYLVLPKLDETAEKHSKDTHLTFVGSMIHLFAKTEQLLEAKEGQIFTHLSDFARVDMANQYFISKLLLTLAHRDLVDQVDTMTKGSQSRVIINDVNPGWCATGLFRHEKEPGFGKQVAFRLMGRTGEAGARTLVHAASAGKETHGKYLSECKVKFESNFVRSKAGRQIQDKVGVDLREVLEGIEPGVTRRV